MAELKIHRTLKHENICHFENWFEANNNIYLVLEFCPHKDLCELIRRRKTLH
jgi:serine/threonine protein kinase